MNRHPDSAYYKIVRLEQENKELIEDNLNLSKENKELKEDLKSQQMINLEQQEIALDYWNALEEIRGSFMCFRSCIIPFHTGDKDKMPHSMADVIQDYCEDINNKINEVLNDK